MMNYFELLGLPIQFVLDQTVLDMHYKNAIKAAHPDRFAMASSAEKVIALQMTSHLNQAYNTLKSPLQRAIYLCALNGYDVEAESNTSMPIDFMMLQMQWREALDSSLSVEQRNSLSQEVLDYEKKILQTVSKAIDQSHHYDEAVKAIRQWMFIEKMKLELEHLPS